MTYIEIKGDLFQHIYREPSNDKMRYTQSNFPVYCHCIANDGKYGAGIAPIFIDKEFKSREAVLEQLKSNPWNGKGWCATKLNELEFSQRILEAHLITKEKTNGKPTYKTLKESLESLIEKMKNLGMFEYEDVVVIRMPKIGCGLDKLDWEKVSKIIKKVFKDTPVGIQVYYL